MTPRQQLAAAGLATLAVRLALVALTPDVELDAYGHFKIARALLADPTNLHVHWVWLPGYHYVLWALLHVGLTFTGLRVLNAVLQAAAPFLLLDLVAHRSGEDPAGSRDAARLAALALTVAPLSNRLATSAQAEVSFALLVLGAAWAVERRRAWLGGALLSAACLTRYEAWGAVAALALHRALKRERAAVGVPAFLLPAATAAGWILVRRAADGEWLTFLRHTHAFASGVRDAQAHPAWLDIGLLPLVLPPLVVGPAILLVPFGLRPAIRLGWLVPAGVLAFLLASHAARGALGLDRYFTALMPFVCVTIADAVLRRPARGPRISARAALVLLALTTAGHLGWMVSRARAREAELRGYETEASTGTRR